MQTRINSLTRAMIAATLFAVSAAAAADSGIYIGGGVGRANLKDENPPAPFTGTFDAKATAYKGFLGYRFGGLPLVDLAAEAAYTDFGNPEQTSAATRAEYKLKGGSIAGLAILPIGPIDLFGKFGGLAWKLDRTMNGVTSSNSGQSPFYGAGVGFKLFGLGVRAEYEYFAVKNIESVQMISVSALYQF